MSDIHSTLSTCVRVCTCVCPHSRLFPLGRQKKTKQTVCTLSKRFNLRVPVFTRECKRFRWIAVLFLVLERKKRKNKKIKAECTRVFTSVFRGWGRRVRLHPNTSAVCHGSTGRVLLIHLRSSAGVFLLPTPCVCAETAAHPSVPHFYVMCLQEGGQQRALAACMHTNL